MLCVHHSSIVESVLTVLKVLCARLVHPASSATLATTTGLLTASLVLPLPEAHIVGIIWYVAGNYIWNRIIFLSFMLPG